MVGSAHGQSGRSQSEPWSPLSESMASVLFTVVSRLTRFSATMTPSSAFCESVRICSCAAMMLAYCGVVRFVAQVLLGAQQSECVKRSRPVTHMTPFDIAGAHVEFAWN